MIRDISMIGRQGTIDDDRLVDINERKKIQPFLKLFQQVEQSSMGHHSLEPLQGSMETFDPRENWTHFGQQLVMVRSLTPSRCRTLKLEV